MVETHAMVTVGTWVLVDFLIATRTTVDVLAMMIFTSYKTLFTCLGEQIFYQYAFSEVYISHNAYGYLCVQNTHS